MSNFFVHPQGLCESADIGEGTRIWAFAHVLPGARIGRDCNICDHVFVENDVVLGDRVTVKCGVQMWDGVRVDDDAFIGPNATFANDPFPRSRQRPERFTPTHIAQGASIGANATIICGNALGEYCFVGAGAVVTKDVPAYALVAGVPAHVIGWMCQCGERLALSERPSIGAAVVCAACGTDYVVTEEGPRPGTRTSGANGAVRR